MGDFGHVIQSLKYESTRKFARAGWNGKGMYISLHRPEFTHHLPFLFMFTAQKEYVPWLASQTDILADDWIEV